MTIELWDVMITWNKQTIGLKLKQVNLAQTLTVEGKYVRFAHK